MFRGVAATRTADRAVGSAVRLADGQTVELLPFRKMHVARLVEMESHLSPHTWYLRYFSLRPPPGARDSSRLQRVDGEEHVGVVARLGAAIVGVATYDHIAGTRDAEFSFLVEDAHQGKGLGTGLLRELANMARAHGIERFVANILAENQHALHAIHDAGFTPRVTVDGGILDVAFPI